MINCSWGKDGTLASKITNALNNAATNGRGGKGCIIVAGSGNDTKNYSGNSVMSPARLSNVIAVGAINRNGLRSNFSNYGPELDVVAPGADISIYTTDRQGTAGNVKAIGEAGNYNPYFGMTSAAAPHVAGVAALILSKNPTVLLRGF